MKIILTSCWFHTLHTWFFRLHSLRCIETRLSVWCAVLAMHAYIQSERFIFDCRLSNAACDAAQLPPSGLPDEPTPVTSNGVVYYEDGGDPIYLDGNIYLCARTDGDSQCFFSGSVAQAGFYNEALNANNIKVRMHCCRLKLMQCSCLMFCCY